MGGATVKWSLMGCALALGVGFSSAALSKPFNSGKSFSVGPATAKNSNPILKQSVLGHYSSDPSVVVVPDSFGNQVMVMVSSSDLVENDAPDWPMNQTFLYALRNVGGQDPIVTTWWDHGAVFSESSFSAWVPMNKKRLWAPDIQYFSATKDLWLYLPDQDSSSKFHIGTAHAAVSNGLYDDAGFKADQTPITLPSIAFDPGVYSDEVKTNKRTWLTYADAVFPTAKNLSIVELGTDHRTVIWGPRKITFTGTLAAYSGINNFYNEGPDIHSMFVGSRLYYYLVFNTNVSNVDPVDNDDTGWIGYAMCSDSAFHQNPDSCWVFKGWIFRNMRTGRSNHVSLVSYGSGHYVFYHVAPTKCCSPENSRARQVAVKEIQLRNHQGFADDGEIIGVTYPATGAQMEDATLYGSLDGLSTTLQPAFISVRDEDRSTTSATLDLSNFVNPSTSVTLQRGLDRLYYYIKADPGQNAQVQLTNANQVDLVLDAPPLKHISGDIWAVALAYTGGNVAPGATSFVNAQLRITGTIESNDFSRAPGNYVTRTTRIQLNHLNTGVLAGESPTNSTNPNDAWKVLYANHQDGNGQFTYLTTSGTTVNFGINNQYLMTGSQLQDWFLEPVTNLSSLQGVGPIHPGDAQNAFRFRCKGTNNFYMTSNDVQKGTAANPKFWVLSQVLNPQWSTQVWIKEDVFGDGTLFRLRSAWMPDVARNTNQVPIYLTLQAATATGKQDVYVQPNQGLDRQQWYIE
jgi:hypothetical protein